MGVRGDVWGVVVVGYAWCWFVCWLIVGMLLRVVFVVCSYERKNCLIRLVGNNARYSLVKGERIIRHRVNSVVIECRWPTARPPMTPMILRPRLWAVMRAFSHHR